jgi:hypothetical protein
MEPVGEYVRSVATPLSVATGVGVGNVGVGFDFVTVADDETSCEKDSEDEMVMLRDNDCSWLLVSSLREADTIIVMEGSDAVSANVLERDTCARVKVGPDSVEVRDATVEIEQDIDAASADLEAEVVRERLTE